MTYGTNTALVEEVIRFAKTPLILRPSTDPPVPINSEVMHDLSEAKAMTWQRAYGADELLWTDIREAEMAEVRRVAYHLKDFE